MSSSSSGSIRLRTWRNSDQGSRKKPELRSSFSVQSLPRRTLQSRSATGRPKCSVTKSRKADTRKTRRITSAISVHLLAILALPPEVFPCGHEAPNSSNPPPSPPCRKHDFYKPHAGAHNQLRPCCTLVRITTKLI